MSQSHKPDPFPDTSKLRDTANLLGLLFTKSMQSCKILFKLKATTFLQFALTQLIISSTATNILFDSSSEAGASSQPQVIQHDSLLNCSRSWLPWPAVKTLNKKHNLQIPSQSHLHNFYATSCRNKSSTTCLVFDRSKKVFSGVKWEFFSLVSCEFNQGENQNSHVYLLYQGVDIQMENPSQAQKLYVRLAQPNVMSPLLALAKRMNRRDFHNLQNISIFLPYAKLALEAGDSVNKTVLTMDKWEIEQDTVLPGFQTCMYSSLLITVNRKSFFNISNHQFRSPDMNYNFAYCASPSFKSVLNYDILLQPFTTKVWTSLLLALVLSTFALLRKISAREIISTFLSLSSTLVLMAVIFDKNIRLKRSALFVSWMYVAIVLSNFYTGILTSLLVKPVEEKTFGELKDLIGNNFSAIFPKYLPTQLLAIKDQLELQGEAKNDEIRPKHTTLVESLRILVGHNPDERNLLEPNFTEALAFHPKTTIFAPWPFAIMGRNKAQALIKASTVTHKSKFKRSCYIGKKLESATPALLCAFYPPGVEKLYHTYQIFVQAGIYFMYLNEFSAMNYASRVQDRLKVKSETVLAPDEDNQFEPMEVAQALRILLLLIILLAICSVCFGFEVIWDNFA
ncbi:unnamed protein product [Orchesella dallaii]|uniref:Uncharacterized protein n=1 Tax=Orchesella dallaii TaxID=48710 RepID=A0ABP1QRN9_9HEXA